jgi:hypothetical protein
MFKKFRDWLERYSKLECFVLGVVCAWVVIGIACGITK